MNRLRRHGIDLVMVLEAVVAAACIALVATRR